MDKRVYRILSLISMIGIGMAVPILGAAYLAGRFYPERSWLVILTVLFGIGVSLRNTYRILMHELSLKSEKTEKYRGRPEGYRDTNPDPAADTDSNTNVGADFLVDSCFASDFLADSRIDSCADSRADSCVNADQNSADSSGNADADSVSDSDTAADFRVSESTRE